MVFKSLNKNIDEFVELVKAYSRTNLAIYKLKAIKVVTQIITTLFKKLIWMMMVPFSLIFFSIAGALVIGDAIGSSALGFAIVGSLHLILAILFVKFGPQYLQRSIIDELTSKLFKKKE